MPLRALAFLSLAAIVSCLLPTTSLAIPVHVWSGGFGSSPAGQTGHSVDIDAAGNVVVVGSFEGTVDFGGGPLGPTGTKETDAYVAKFDPVGGHLWSRRFGAADNQFAYAVALDSGGNVLIAVQHAGTVDFGGGPIAALGNDVVVVKLDASGAHLWSQRYGDANLQAPRGIAVDPFDNVLVTGFFDGTIDFGCGPMASSGAYDVYLAKLDPAGTCLWSKRAGNSAFQSGNSVATDSAGNVFVAGEFEGTFDFGGGPLTSAGLTDILLAKLDPSGVHLWSKRFGTATGAESSQSIACDAAGHVSLAGVVRCVPPGKFDPPCNASIDFGGGPLSGFGSNDVVLADFDPSGSHMWSKLFGDAANQSEASVAIDTDGDRVYYGTFTGTVDFGTGPLTAPSGSSLFLAQYSPSGLAEWSYAYGAPGTAQHGHGVAAHSSKIAITGDNAGSVNFGGGNISTGSITNADIFVAKFSDDGAVPVLISSFTATARDAGIEVQWSMSHDEELASFSLYRRDQHSPQPIQVAGGEFVDVEGSYFDVKVAPATTYHYELVIRASSGDEFRSPVVTATTPVVAVALGQNRPNPFNPETMIEYSVTERAPVVVGIYDATGALVTRLDEGMREPGTFRVRWDGRNASGSPAGSGVYFYRLEGSRETAAKKMVLLK